MRGDVDEGEPEYMYVDDEQQGPKDDKQMDNVEA